MSKNVSPSVYGKAQGGEPLWFVVSIRPFLDATKRYGLT